MNCLCACAFPFEIAQRMRVPYTMSVVAAAVVCLILCAHFVILSAITTEKRYLAENCIAADGDGGKKTKIRE